MDKQLEFLCNIVVVDENPFLPDHTKEQSSRKRNDIGRTP